MTENEPTGGQLFLTTREHRALRDLLAAQIEFEDGTPPEPTAEERDQTMHGVRHPIQDGEAVIYPIACRAAELATRRNEMTPNCRWVADDSGIEGSVSCTRCGKCEGPGMVRHEKLRSMVDGTYLPRTTLPKITITHGGGWHPENNPRPHDPSLDESGASGSSHFHPAAVAKGTFPAHNGPGGSYYKDGTVIRPDGKIERWDD